MLSQWLMGGGWHGAWGCGGGQTSIVYLFYTVPLNLLRVCVTWSRETRFTSFP